MRVLISGWFLGYPDTGTGQYVREMIARLPVVRPGWEIGVAFPEGWGSALPEGVTPVPIRLPRAPRALRKIWFEQFALPQAAARWRADRLFVPYWAPPLRAPAPIIVTVHDLIPLLFPEYRSGFGVRLYTALVRAATPGAARILTDSEASRQDILRRLRVPPERVVAIPLGVSERFTPRPDPIADARVRTRYDLPPAYVLYLGGFDRRKNIETLLAVYTWAQEAIGYNFPLVIAGRLPEGSHRLFVDPRPLARAWGLEEVIRCIGPVDEADKPALYRGASAFLYPSRYEGFGLPVLEAMACGVPVVASEIPALAELAGDAAYLVPPDDARGMAGALIAVLVDAHLGQTLRERGLRRAAQFSWRACAERTAEAIEGSV
ncbi:MULTISPECIES: glycosyltransferase family 4 protein [Thermoflexus]|jgi:glycosyltransferase involved in cell wall biosynthesis|uniref:glycosyltransferase family 4 protein n=1 Tax=Thermoflexus TaxID=1495649 RepID=UPI001C793F02|nr:MULTISPECIES: glycosyltransferase family 1 protein [Thermoflexus]QWK11985.1 MAG: glycosyltransferase family 4 protein [Thermoflexus hugenholtzii]